MSKSKPANKSRSKPFDYWLHKNKYYHHRLIKFFKFAIPKNSKVLVINCKNGYLLDSLEPSVGVGMGGDEEALQVARSRYPNYKFYAYPIENIQLQETFDYIVLPSVTMETNDIQNLFERLHKFCDKNTRIIIDIYSYLWEPTLKLTQKLGLKRPTNLKNWISKNDMQNFLCLSGFEKVTHGHRMLVPMYIPIISTFFNSFLAQIPLIRRLCLHEWIIARPMAKNGGASDLSKDLKEPKRSQSYHKPYSVSVIVPCKNERGNIEKAVTKCPNMGKYTEIIFVEGNSKDGTFDEIKRVANAYKDKNIKYYQQDGKGKGDAVRKGFANATGDILMILDADLTTPPEELTKFFEALANNKGEFINGSRLVYGMESNAMRPIAILANFSFGLLLRWIIGQKIKDSLCGTKVLFKKDYEKIAKNRSAFGSFDPFGDFDLLFGAAKLNLKIIDMPVHYKDRTYGATQINRFKHFWFLLLMSFIAWRYFKLR
ncbi:glycosyltransferase [Candidatus Dependentiae bacterium]